MQRSGIVAERGKRGVGSSAHQGWGRAGAGLGQALQWLPAKQLLPKGATKGQLGAFQEQAVWTHFLELS